MFPLEGPAIIQWEGASPPCARGRDEVRMIHDQNPAQVMPWAGCFMYVDLVVIT